MANNVNFWRKFIFISFNYCSFMLLIPCDATTNQALIPLRNLAVTSDTSFSFDLSLVIPIPVIGNITVDVQMDVPLKIRFMNSTLAYRPIKIPYLILPEPKPIVFDLNTYNEPNYGPSNYGSTTMGSYGQASTNNNYYSEPGDSYYASEYNSPYFDGSSSDAISSGQRRSFFSFGKKKQKTAKSVVNGVVSGVSGGGKRKDYWKHHQPSLPLPSPQQLTNYTHALRYFHQRHKRDIGEASAQHRADLFSVITDALDNYGIDGVACVCRAICELAEMEFLIESPAHELVEHLLRVSRAHDTDGLLYDYVEAEKFGHQSFMRKNWNGCAKRYDQCPFSIFDRVFHPSNQNNKGNITTTISH